MKRTVLLLGLLLAPALGCSPGPEPAGEAAAPEDERPRVALIMKSLANEFFSKMAEGAEQHQAENSDRYSLVVNGIKDERDLSRQVALVEEMVAAGVGAIVIAPADSKALVPALRRARASGVVVVNIDNRLDADVLKQEGIEIPFVGPDNREGARVVGDYLAQNADATPLRVAILEGVPTSFNAQQRKLGFEDAVAKAGGTVVASQTADWEMAKANSVASSVLSEHPEVNAVMASNDSMAMGALAAVKSAGRSGEVAIVGFDNISAVQSAIRDGSVLATADQHGGELAVFGIEAALNMLAGEPVEGDVQTPVDLVTAETLAAQAEATPEGE